MALDADDKCRRTHRLVDAVGVQTPCGIPLDLVRIIVDYDVDVDLMVVVARLARVQSRVKPLKECLKGNCSGGCGTPINSNNVIYSGGNVNMNNYFVCPDCLRGDKPLVCPIRCDHWKWQTLFNLPVPTPEMVVTSHPANDVSPSRTIKNMPCAAEPFDLRVGWHRNVEGDEDLCSAHAKRLFASADEKQEKLKRQFRRRVSTADLVPIQTLDQLVWVHGSAALLPWRAVELTMPPGLHAGQIRHHPWLNKNPWLDKNPENNDDGDEKEDRGTDDWVFWDMLASVHGYDLNSVGAEGLIPLSFFSNLYEWLPFDRETLVSHNNKFNGWVALANCNADSPQFGQVATAVAYDYEFAVDLAPPMDVATYWKQKQEYMSEGTKQIVVHPNVCCDGCRQQPLVGTRWKYGLVDYCTRCLNTPTIVSSDYRPNYKPVKPSFIAFIRHKLDQTLDL